MARLLSCPHCRAEFTFDDWARGTSCPACGQPPELLRGERPGRAASCRRPGAAPAAPVVRARLHRPTTGRRRRRAARGRRAGARGPPCRLPPPRSSAVLTAPPVEVARRPRGLPPWMNAGGSELSPAPAPRAAEPPCRRSGATCSSSPRRRRCRAGPRARDEPPIVEPLRPSPPCPAASAVAAPPPVDAVLRPRTAAARRIGGRGTMPSAARLSSGTGWTVVVVVWALVAVGLVATRVEMGDTHRDDARARPRPSPRCSQIRLPTGASTEAVLRYAATHDLNSRATSPISRAARRCGMRSTGPGSTASTSTRAPRRTAWWARTPMLSWTVSNGVAKADAATRAALTKAAQTMAHPPSSNSVRPIPGIIPSLPPDLQ